MDFTLQTKSTLRLLLCIQYVNVYFFEGFFIVFTFSSKKYTQVSERKLNLRFFTSTGDSLTSKYIDLLIKL